MHKLSIHIIYYFLEALDEESTYQLIEYDVEVVM